MREILIITAEVMEKDQAEKIISQKDHYVSTAPPEVLASIKGTVPRIPPGVKCGFVLVGGKTK